MPLPPGELDPLLRLSLVRGVGPQRFGSLVERFGSPSDVLRAGGAALARVPGIGARLAREITAIAGASGDARVNRALRALDRAGGIALAPHDPAYPARFRRLSDPPFLLFAAGDLSLLDRPGIAMVGTRSPTHYGREVVAMLGNAVAFAGYCVVSGMARGIDTLAHRAALDARGATIGVLGHGIDVVYPPENRELFDAVRERGLLVTEMPPGEKPLAGNFPRRNRLIAALSRSVLVVEMGLKSGAQHTVTYALELGLDVMAVPGPVTSHASAGTNQLIREGARVVTCARDVLEELGGVGAAAIATAVSAQPAARTEQVALDLVTPDERRILASLGREPRHVDQLEAVGVIGTGRLLALLLEMELKGIVEALPGKMYRRR